MKAIKIRMIALGVALAAVVSAQNARAILVVGDAYEAGSWAQRFVEDISAVTHMEAFMVSPAPTAFKAPGFLNFSVPGWSVATVGSPIRQIIADGSGPKDMQFDIFFDGEPSTPLTFDFFGWNGTTLVDSARASWNGSGWSFSAVSSAPIPTVVPEPSTILAGALLLLPFAASTIRRFRKTS